MKVEDRKQAAGAGEWFISYFDELDVVGLNY